MNNLALAAGILGMLGVVACILSLIVLQRFNKEIEKKIQSKNKTIKPN